MKTLKTYTFQKALLILGIFAFISSCKDVKFFTFEKQKIDVLDFLDCNTQDCAYIEVYLIQSIDNSPAAKNINKEIEKTVFSILNIEEDSAIKTIQEAIISFNTSFQHMKAEFPEDILDFEVSIDSEVSFQNKDIVCIVMDSYIFTGGAHGNGSTLYVNFSAETGNIIENDRLLKNPNQFLETAEKAFRKAYKIPDDLSINSTGFFFENDKFTLPSTIGFTDYEVVLYYNQYEISSYTEGPVVVKLKKEDVAPFFNFSIL